MVMFSFFVCVFLASRSFALSPLYVCTGHDGGGSLCADGSFLHLRGSNYIRLTKTSTSRYHSTFSPESYNRTRYNRAIVQMQHDGYNVVRVFVDGAHVGASSSTTPFDESYVSRMADFVNDAAQHGLYTIVTLEWLPNNDYFRSFYAGVPRLAEGMNSFYLQKEFHDAWEAYAYQLAQRLKQDLSTDGENGVVLSLQNELFLDSNKLPFSDVSRSITCADGKTYAMNDPGQRQEAQDSNVNLWAARTRNAWRTVLPESLVTVGVFTFQAVGKSGPNGLMCSSADCRFPARPYWLSRSQLDFLDVHIYQKDGSSQVLDSNLETEEWSGLDTSKPIIMGEFGCLGGLKGGGWYSSAQECAAHMKDLQVSSCARGFSGWLFWTWDTDTLNEQPEWFSMMDQNGAINGILAPIAYPSACAKSGNLV